MFGTLHIRLTLCRCVLWKWPHAQGSHFSTWSITSRGNTSSTTRTLALCGTITCVLHLRYFVPACTKCSCHWRRSVIHISRCSHHNPVVLGFQSLYIWTLGTPADSSGHSGCWRPLHRPSDPHREGHWLWWWKFGYLYLFLQYTHLGMVSLESRRKSYCHGLWLKEGKDLFLMSSFSAWQSVCLQAYVAWPCSSTLTCVTRSVRVWGSHHSTWLLQNVLSWTAPTSCWLVWYHILFLPSG